MQQFILFCSKGTFKLPNLLDEVNLHKNINEKGFIYKFEYFLHKGCLL